MVVAVASLAEVEWEITGLHQDMTMGTGELSFKV